MSANELYKLQYQNSNLKQELQQHEKKERIYQQSIMLISIISALMGLALVGVVIL